MKSYGYGYHCCIMRDRGSHDLKDVLQKAISEGYSFVVEYQEEPEISRKLMFWKGMVLDYNEAMSCLQHNLEYQRMLQAYFEKGNKVFMLAPAPNGELNVFPVQEFEEIEDISQNIDEMLK